MFDRKVNIFWTSRKFQFYFWGSIAQSWKLFANTVCNACTAQRHAKPSKTKNEVKITIIIIIYVYYGRRRWWWCAEPGSIQKRFWTWMGIDGKGRADSRAGEGEVQRQNKNIGETYRAAFHGLVVRPAATKQSVWVRFPDGARSFPRLPGGIEYHLACHTIREYARDKLRSRLRPTRDVKSRSILLQCDFYRATPPPNGNEAQKSETESRGWIWSFNLRMVGPERWGRVFGWADLFLVGRSLFLGGSFVPSRSVIVVGCGTRLSQ